MPKQLPLSALSLKDWEGESGMHLVRLWNLVRQLSSESKGLTVLDLTAAWNVSSKTIQRDILFLKKLGCDLVFTTDKYGRKFWRIRNPFERLRGKRTKYRAIGETLAEVLEHARSVGDKRLIADLEAVQKRAMRKAK